ncbi:MAG TPA: DUF6232 family protein, partial [Pilimelia sp.]|nr:DUF6232 family protein [Pilimelia sp.]
WRALAGRGALGLALLVPLVLAALGIVVALSLDAAFSTTLAIIAGAVLVGLGVGPLADVLLEHLDRSYTRGWHAYELWAERHGHEVLLLRTRDRLRFGKIYRAVQRAAEHGWAPPPRVRPVRRAVRAPGR